MPLANVTEISAKDNRVRKGKRERERKKKKEEVKTTKDGTIEADQFILGHAPMRSGQNVEQTI